MRGWLVFKKMQTRELAIILAAGLVFFVFRWVCPSCDTSRYANSPELEGTLDACHDRGTGGSFWLKWFLNDGVS